MSTMPEFTQSALSALRHLQPADRAAAVAVLSTYAHRDKIDVDQVVDYYFTGGQPSEDTAPDDNPHFRSGYTSGYLAALAQAVRMRAENVELAELREQLLACPDWCVLDHAGDDPADPIDNLILHQGDDHNDGVTRKVMDGGKLSIQVSRTDCPQEGRIGTPVLRVAADMELTTWEQAAELARAILDGFGYLEGADRA